MEGETHMTGINVHRLKADFRAFVAAKPADETYHFWDTQSCAVAQFCSSRHSWDTDYDNWFSEFAALHFNTPNNLLELGSFGELSAALETQP